LICVIGKSSIPSRKNAMVVECFFTITGKSRSDCCFVPDDNVTVIQHFAVIIAYDIAALPAFL
jgi:hypothetical protein